MKNPFVTHLFSKIAEGEYEKTISASAARLILEHLESIGESIRQSQRDEVREKTYLATVKSKGVLSSACIL